MTAPPAWRQIQAGQHIRFQVKLIKMSSHTNTISIRAPDDFHLHLRDTHTILTNTVNCTAASNVHRAIIMPNLQPPVTQLALAYQYYHRIINALDPQYKQQFQPLMTLYLTHSTTPEIIAEAATFKLPNGQNLVYACKLYPAGATTHSSAGIHLDRLSEFFPVFSAMQTHNLVLCIHGETTNPATDIYKREVEFVQKYLPLLVEKFPQLKIVLEHATTQEAVDFIISHNSGREKFYLAATLTVQHLLFNRNNLFAGGLNVHNYCLPILKSASNQRALVSAATNPDPAVRRYFFAGTDSAPHSKSRKESGCCAAGCFTAPLSVELYAEIFAQTNALQYLQQFLSENGANFYNLPLNAKFIELSSAEPWQVVAELEFDGEKQEKVVPFYAGQVLHWKIKGKNYDKLIYSDNLSGHNGRNNSGRSYCKRAALEVYQKVRDWHLLSILGVSFAAGFFYAGYQYYSSNSSSSASNPPGHAYTNLHKLLPLTVQKK
jgi:dihydroorotase